MTAVRAVATRATAAGEGGIATVLLAGDDAPSVVRALFRPRTAGALDDNPTGRALLGDFGRADAAVDEVVVTFAPAGGLGSTPGEIAIHGHGGHATTSAILALLEEEGVRVVDPADYAIAAGADHASDPVRAAAHEALLSARTGRAALLLVAQWKGALSTALAALDRRLEALAADGDAGGMPAILDELEALLDAARLGVRLVEGATVVLAGAPNAGKSTLFNALVRVDRVLTSDEPGTTRDAIDAVLDLEGVPVRLVDTPGLAEFEDEISRRAVERAGDEIEAADLVLWLVDAGEPTPDPAERPGAGRPFLLVRSRADRDGVATPGDGGLRVSAKTGEGLAALREALAERLGADEPLDPAAPAPFRSDLVRLLAGIRDRLAGEDARQEPARAAQEAREALRSGGALAKDASSSKSR